MLQYRSLPMVAFGAGIVGFGLHRWQLQTAFEQDTNLPLRAAFYAVPSTLTSVLFSIAFLTFCLYFIFLRKQPTNTTNETGASHSRYPFFFVLVASIFSLASSILTVNHMMIQPNRSILLIAFALCSVLSTIAMFIVAKHLSSKKNLPMSFVWLAILLGSCSWVIVSYPSWAENPYVWRYFYTVLCLVTIMLAHYYITAHMFEQVQTKYIALFSSCAIFLCLITLADPGTMATKFLTIAQIFYFLPAIFMFQSNGFHPILDTTLDTSDNNPLKEDND